MSVERYTDLHVFCHAVGEPATSQGVAMGQIHSVTIFATRTTFTTETNDINNKYDSALVVL